MGAHQPLIVHDGKFSASSCDGFRLTVASEDAAQDEPIDLLLPADAMKTMLAVFRGIPHCKIGVDGDTALFLGPNLVFTCQLSPYQAMNITPILEHFQPACEVHVDGTLSVKNCNASAPAAQPVREPYYRRMARAWCRSPFSAGVDNLC